VNERQSKEIATPGADGPRFTLQELFRGKSRQEWRAVYAGAFDWGPDLGRETVEE
jgi:hypothetical protein